MSEIAAKYRFVCELDMGTASRLVEMAKKRGVSKNAMIRFVINHYYEREFK